MWAVQVDNETPDWRYLSALKELGESMGIMPSFYTKTGWPAPSAGYPSDYPMLPFFGGYPDLFWSSAMHANPADQQYVFVDTPSAAAARSLRGSAGPAERSKWAVPDGYPWLDIEIGAGMATAYNHRVHMDSEDMPSMHTVFVGDGVNALGYYMCGPCSVCPAPSWRLSTRRAPILFSLTSDCVPRA